jgi:Na+-translocating ferredoxin:NAD+ oxidoreductase subunit G
MTQTQPGEMAVPGFMDRLKNSNIVQAWLVLTLALFFGASLAGVQITLGPTIEANKLNETLKKVPELVLGPKATPAQSEALDVTSTTITVEKQGKKVFYNTFAAKLDNNIAGWVVKTSGQGYADKIELLVGLDPAAETITGLFILDQKETPGLGNKIITPEWRGQFEGKKTGATLMVVKTGAKAPVDIDAVTGATISSRAVTDIINTAVKDLREKLALMANSK